MRSRPIMMIGSNNAEIRVPVGGIAHAVVRGISKAEVRVDDGVWMSAESRALLSGQTWVLWRYDWPFKRAGTRLQCLVSKQAVSLRLNRKGRPPERCDWPGYTLGNAFKLRM